MQTIKKLLKGQPASLFIRRTYPSKIEMGNGYNTVVVTVTLKKLPQSCHNGCFRPKFFIIINFFLNICLQLLPCTK